MGKIKLFIMSKGKPNSCLTQELLMQEGVEFTTVVSSGDDVKQYRKNYGSVLVAPAKCHTLAIKKEWLISQTPNKKWVLLMDDNIYQLIGTGKTGGKLSKKEAVKPFSFKELTEEVVPRDIELASFIGAPLGGFASNDNVLFRQKQYRHVGFVWGKIAYYQSLGIEWPRVKAMDDYGIVSEVHKQFGRVLINNFIHPRARRYQAIGGDGAYEKRIPAKQEAVSILMRLYPGLYNIANKPNLAPNSELRMRFTSTAQVDKWRMGFNSGYVKT